jgi:hypothetical protein
LCFYFFQNRGLPPVSDASIANPALLWTAALVAHGYFGISYMSSGIFQFSKMTLLPNIPIFVKYKRKKLVRLIRQRIPNFI